MNEMVFRYKCDIENLFKDYVPDTVIKVNISDSRFYYAIEWIDGEKFNLEIENGEYVYTHMVMAEHNPSRTFVSKYETEELALLAWLMGVGGCICKGNEIKLKKFRDLINKIVRENDFGLAEAIGEDKCFAAFEIYKQEYLCRKDKKEGDADALNNRVHRACLMLYYELLMDERYSAICESENGLILMQTILYGCLFDVCDWYHDILWSRWFYKKDC